MRDPLTELEHLKKLAISEPTRRFGKLMRLVQDVRLLEVAAERVRHNTGGRTAGIDGQTRKHIDESLLYQLADELTTQRYQPKAVRRAYIPKGKTGQRPLGIPAIRDRIVQAAIAQVLEVLYEPIFRDCSYGFRPGRNTIQALRQVAQAFQAGATWTIEGDLVKCFDSIPHGVILNCLRRRIKDERFIDLIRKLLEAGVMEEEKYTRTYSGTPQGGLASPILSNIVLHEFDRYLEDEWQANPPPLTPKQQNARTNPEYARHKRNLVRWRGQLKGRIPMGRQTQEGLRAKIKAALQARKQVPSVLPRRLISFCRYADDYVCVLSQYSKAQAQQLKQAMAKWLKENLGLTQHPDKTHITHWDKRFRFLGYDLRGRRNLNGTRWLRLEIPPEKERELKGKVKRLCGYTQIPALDLFVSVNALLRGWSNYFRFANNAPARFDYLTGVVYWLGAHYLGRKHRSSIKKIMRTHYAKDPASGKQALYITNPKGKRVFIWNKPPDRQSVYSRVLQAKDAQPLPIDSWSQGHSYEQRLDLRSRFEQGCEHCGKLSPKLIVHHPNRLSRLGKRKQGPANIIASGQEQWVELLCPECHKLHHPQGWHDGKTKFSRRKLQS